MKRGIVKKIVSLCMAVLMAFLANPILIHAQENQDVIIEIQNDKSEYKKDEEAKVKVKVTNNHTTDITNVHLNLNIPKGLLLTRDTKSNVDLGTIKQGYSSEYTVYLKQETKSLNNDPSKNDGANTSTQTNFKLWLSITLLIGGLLILLLIRKFKLNNISKKIGLFILSLAVGLGTLSAYNFKINAAEGKNVSNQSTIKFGENEYTLEANASYEIDSNEKPPVVTENVTREDWITNLVKALNINVDQEITEFSFTDHDKVNDPKLIETAIRYNLIALSEEKLFNPEQDATREFVSYSVVHGMQYQVEEVSPSWNDSVECQYLYEDNLAVELGLFQLNDNYFFPNASVTQEEQENILAMIEESMQGPSGDSDDIVYADGVEETHLNFELDEVNKCVIIYDKEKVSDWKTGEIHVLIHESDPNQSIAINISSIEENEDSIIFYYETPNLEQVIKSMNISGTETEGGTFTPAEGITIVEDTKSRIGGSGSIDGDKLFKKRTLKIPYEDLDIKITFAIDSLDYKFNFNIFALKNAYIRTVFNSSAKLELSGELSEEKKVKLGSFNVPIGTTGIIIDGDINAVLRIDGTVEFEYEIKNKAGVEYKSGLRFINKTTSSLNEFLLEAQVRAGLSIEPDVKYLKIGTLLEFGVEVGKSFDATLNTVSLNPWKYCLDGDLYTYLTLSGNILPVLLDYDFEVEVLNRKNAIDKQNSHFEETGFVDECTRRNVGNLKAVIKDKKDPSQLIKNATVEIIKNDEIFKKVNVKDGNINIKDIPIGQYTLLIISDGYENYSLDIQINNNEVLDLKDILMNSTEEVEDKTFVLKAGKTYQFDFVDSNVVLTALPGNPSFSFEVLSYDLTDKSLLNETYGSSSWDWSGGGESGFSFVYEEPSYGQNSIIEASVDKDIVCQFERKTTDESGYVEVEVVDPTEDTVKFTELNRPIMRNVEITNGQILEINNSFSGFGPFFCIPSGKFLSYEYSIDDGEMHWKEYDGASKGEIHVGYAGDDEKIKDIQGTTNVLLPYAFDEYLSWKIVDEITDDSSLTPVLTE